MSIDAVTKAIETLIEAGWSHIGVQPTKMVRTHSGGSPFPNAEIKTGGRQKLELPGTQRRATVGPRSVCFFVYDGRECQGFQTVKTKDIAAIKKLVFSFANKAFFDNLKSMDRKID